MMTEIIALVKVIRLLAKQTDVTKDREIEKGVKGRKKKQLVAQQFKLLLLLLFGIPTNYRV